MVAVALLGYVMGAAGMFFAFGLFFKPLDSAFHWSREAISGFTSIAGVVYALTSPFVGRLADRFGRKRVILCSTVLYAAVFAAQGFLTGRIWQFYALAALMGPAAAGTSALTYGKIISTWFDRSRGMALSILACGAGLGSVVIPPFTQFLIGHYGWRAAYLLLGVCTLTLGTIPVALILQDGPGAKATNIASSTLEPREARSVRPGNLPVASKSQILTSYPFLTLLAVSAMIGITYVGVLTHLVPLLTDRGLTAEQAARLVSLLGGAAIAGHLLIGVCLDRFPAARVTALMLTLSGIGVAGIGVARPGVALTLAVIFLGAALGADNGVMPYLVGRYFGLASYGEFLGYFMAAGTLGAAGGALLMGRVFDRYHSYLLMTNLIAAASLVAALLVYLLPRPTEACKQSE